MKKKIEQEEPLIIEDSILAGILIAKGHKVLPELDVQQRVQYCVYGDVKKSLKEIYDNSLIGSLSALTGIKSARQMIFTLRRGVRG
ncbi:MAG: hypothetical protein OEW04_11525 [Nitrospirota bacterium]|nr:hypothetical protein [Nitrospirota bacterium]